MNKLIIALVCAVSINAQITTVKSTGVTTVRSTGATKTTPTASSINLASGLIVTYPLNEGTTGSAANDVSANDLDGTANGSPTLETGQIGGARGSTAGSQYFSVGNNAVFATQTFTVCGWFYYTSDFANFRALASKWNSSGTCEWQVRANRTSDGKYLQLLLSQDGTTTPAITIASTVTLVASTIYKFSIGFDDAANVVFVRVGTASNWLETTQTTAYTGTMANGSANFRIMTYQGAATSVSWIGWVDDISMWNRRLTDAEIDAALAAEGPY